MPRHHFFVLILLAILCPLGDISAQYVDNFDQGDLVGNGWTGELDRFVMNTDDQLQLMDTMPGSSNVANLGRSLATGDSTSWEFWCQLDFSPSAANYADVYLALDAADIATGNGYLVRIGGISGDQDEIGLYKKTGNEFQLLTAGVAGGAGGNTVDVRIRVIRTADFFWELWVDYAGGSNFVLEGEAFDDAFPLGSYFGFNCVYSSTRADKFFFDDLIIGPEFVDQVPPFLSSHGVDGNGQLNLVFSEALNPSSISNSSNYQFNPAVTFSPAQLVPGSLNEIAIAITDGLVSGNSYSLSLSGIEDAFGNAIQDTIISFDFLEIETAAAFDILISEIMADPSPSVGLPEYEYIEIWNRSDKNIQLDELNFEDGAGIVSLPFHILQPNAYLALTHTSSAELLDFDNVLGVPGFPTLTNGGEQLSLYNTGGELIHRLNYSNSWYQDADRDEGGYSLELINPLRLCEGQNNWRASIAPIGGSPGLINANYDESSSSGSPSILNAIATNDQGIKINFSQALSEGYLLNVDNYDLRGYSITNAIVSENGQTVSLSITPQLLPNEVHTLSLSAPVLNCTGDPFSVDLSWNIGLPSAAEIGDLHINEVLFNPRSGSKDYVELLNASDKIIDLSEFFIATVDEDGIIDAEGTLPQEIHLFPNSYIALTEDVFDVETQYPDPDRPGRIVTTNLPTMSDTEGTVLIYRNAFPDVEVFDRFDYLDDYHNALLGSLDGVALERLSLDILTNVGSNWSSAASNAGYGTPAAPNSQQIGTPGQAGDSPFDLGPARLSPDDDGFEDFLPINYSAETGDFVLSMRLYNAAGQLIKVLVNNQTVGNQALFRWDGDMNGGGKAPVGLYILWAERFNQAGIVERYKHTIVVATMLN